MRRIAFLPSFPNPLQIQACLSLFFLIALADRALSWDHLSGHGLASARGALGLGPAALNSNPAFMPDARHSMVGTAGVDLEKVHGLPGVWSFLGHAAYQGNLWIMGLAWDRENWLGKWKQDNVRLAVSCRASWISLGAAWESERESMHGHGEWRAHGFRLGALFRGGPTRLGFYQKSRFAATWAKTPFADPIFIACAWTGKPGIPSSFGHFEWAGHWAVNGGDAWRGNWEASFTWGPGFRIALGWAEVRQTASAALVLPWGAWAWQSGWRHQARLGRTLGAGLLWHGHQRDSGD